VALAGGSDVEIDWAVAGGVLCGALAGGAARFGRLCTMSAIEDALIGRDWRGAKAWLLALVVAALTTLALDAAGLADIAQSHYAAPRLHLFGVIAGGLVFGLGMTLVGTCSFGLIVRAGAGDMRAGVSALTVGIAAFAVTAGVLAPLRERLLAVGVVDLAPYGGASLDRLAAPLLGGTGARLAVALLLAALAAAALVDARVRHRRRLVAGAVGLGLAVAAGWAVTAAAVANLTATRVESLSFVAPVGRLLLQAMMLPFRDASFGVAAVLGVAGASFAVAAWRRELRWEAFDDATEMRRHLCGAALMGVGGVLAQGCTIGQGLSAASTLALSAPLFMLALLAGARIGLKLLIEGTSLWRLGFSPRADR
jgi:hypothetical protein